MSTPTTPQGHRAIYKAIYDRLTRDGVNKSVQKYWNARDLQNVEAKGWSGFWKKEAPKGAPHPRVIYKIIGDSMISQSSGRTADEKIQYRQAIVDFYIETTIDENRDDSYVDAIVEIVQNAIENGKLVFEYCCNFITLIPQSPIDGPDDEKNDFTIVRYQINYEAYYTLSRLTAT